MKFLVVLAGLVSASVAQRPSYAGSFASGVSDLHPRFRPSNNSANQDGTTIVGNRVGDTSSRIPIDARGDPTISGRPFDSRPNTNSNQGITVNNQESSISNQESSGGNRRTTVSTQDPTVSKRPFGSRSNTNSNQGITVNNQESSISNQESSGGNRRITISTQDPTVSRSPFESRPDSNQLFTSRFGGSANRPSSFGRYPFSSDMNGGQRKYVYDYMRDTWIRRF